MTNGEARMLETDAVIFQMESNSETQESKLLEMNSVEIETEKQSIKVDIKNRFTRLKKSLRKRSASIL